MTMRNVVARSLGSGSAQGPGELHDDTGSLFSASQNAAGADAVCREEPMTAPG